MMMLPELRIAVCRPIYACLKHPIDHLVDTPVCIFTLMEMPEGRVFYECSRCSQCGCPSSERSCSVEQDVIDHLHWHAQLCAGSVSWS